jgi:CxxC motif-containing protein
VNEKKFICIRCPKGCEILTTLDGYAIKSIKGNVCKLGSDYVQQEIEDPRRIITTTVKVKNGIHPLVPVWTTDGIPKAKIFELMSILRSIELDAPVEPDTLILKNVFDTGVDIVTSAGVQKEKNLQNAG